MSVKWYKKASVQSAMIYAVPQLFTILISIIAIKVTWISANRQIHIYQKQLEIIEEDKNLSILSEKAELRNLCGSVVDTLKIFFKNNNPQPQEPLKLGESRIINYQSDLRLHYNLQNEWAKNLNKLLSNGLDNKYLLQNDSAIVYWSNAICFSQAVISITESFINKDFSFTNSYNFDKLYQRISDDYFNAYRILFDSKKK